MLVACLHKYSNPKFIHCGDSVATVYHQTVCVLVHGPTAAITQTCLDALVLVQRTTESAQTTHATACTLAQILMPTRSHSHEQ